MFRRFCIIVCLVIGMGSSGWSRGVLEPVKTDHPRDTMRSFMEAMQDYKKGLDNRDEVLRARLSDAVRCLDLEGEPRITRQARGEEVAILLKEVIDRVIVIDYAKIPADRDKSYWRLRNTEIEIVCMPEGHLRQGRYLFSQDTVARVNDFFEKVRNLPYLKGSGGGAGYREPWLEENVPAWARRKFATVSYWQWIGLFFSILLGLTMRVLVRVVAFLAHKLAAKTKTQWDDLLIKKLGGAVALFGAGMIWYASVYLMMFEGTPLIILTTAAKLVLFAALIWIFYAAVDVFTQYLTDFSVRTNSVLDNQIVKLISQSLKVFVVIFGVLLGAQNLGIDVFSLLAGLGIGGLAVALAAKDSLANFFGSIMIMFDRPFRVGHWVLIGKNEGTVEEIGFRSTKIRTFYNSLITIPNSEIAIGTVDNMGLRTYRRIRTVVGITYDTPPEKLEAFLEGIKNIIKANPYTRKDYFHVVFNEFGSSSLDIMLYFFVKVENWSEELLQRQNIFLEIIRLAKAIGVDFAFPTQSLHIETFPEKDLVRKPHELDLQKLGAEAADFGPSGAKSRPAGSGIHVPPFKDPDLVE